MTKSLTTVTYFIGVMITYTQVLVVDDDLDDHFLIQSVFKRFAPAVEIQALYDGDELLPCLDASLSHPNLVLLDLNMNKMNGFLVLDQIRSNSVYSDLPVIVFSTSSSSDDKNRSLELGASGFIIKPSRLDDFELLVRQLVRDWDL